MTSRIWLALAATGALALGIAACGGDDDGGGSGLSGTIAIDGSSTVFPYAQAAAEEFQAMNPKLRISVGQSGTGGGFEKFCRGEIDIADASRPIKDEEIPVCEEHGVEFKEVQVANDGIAVVTNPELEIDCLTTEQLEKLWQKNSDVQRYSQLGPGLPDTEVSLFGPGTDSGTFDFFTDEINGEEGNTRKDYQPSEDDNVLVQGVTGDAGGLGYFGFSFYTANKDRLNLVGVDAGAGCVKPSKETIQDGTYKPLARPIFMYPSVKALQRPEVRAFMDFVLENHRQIAEFALAVPMTEAQAIDGKQAVQEATEAGGA